MPRLSIELPQDNGKSDFLVEINLRRFTTITYPRVKYIQGTSQPLHIFISRQATVLELHAEMCKKYAQETDSKYTVEELLELSRLWKFEGNDTFEDAKTQLAEINSDLS